MSRSYSARRLNGPWLKNPNATPTSTTAFANAPNFASVHDGTMTTIDTTTAHAPIVHHTRGQTNSETAVARKSSAATSHSAPNATEMGCVSCGRSAQPNAFGCAQEVDQTVDDEQNGEGRQHACSAQTGTPGAMNVPASRARHLWMNSVAACANKHAGKELRAPAHVTTRAPTFRGSTGPDCEYSADADGISTLAGNMSSAGAGRRNSQAPSDRV